MKPILLNADDGPDRAALIEPDQSLPDLLEALAARMTPDQRHAFFEKMAQMDRQRSIPSPTVPPRRQ